MLGALFRSKEPDEYRMSAWGEWGGSSSTWTGQTVTTSSALQLLAVYGSVRLISDSISTLPIDVFRQFDDDKIEVAKPRWLDQPTVDLGFPEWCSQVLSSLLLSGNAYVAVTRSATAQIVEMIPLDPAQVQIVRPSPGRKVYLVAGQPYDGELLHIKGLMLPGSDVGLSPLEAARQSIGLGLSAQQYGAQFFDGEGNMPGVIEIPGKAQPDTMKAMAEGWARKRTRRNKGLPGVLESGATWKPTGVTNEQAQFLSTRQFTAAEVAGQMFLLDPSDLGIPVAGTSLTYANLEQRNARRVQVTLLPWIVRIERAISALLAAPRYMKFNVDGLLRGDTLSRWQTYEIASRINASAATVGQSPVLLTTEMRDLEDFPPIPDSTPTPDDLAETKD